MSEISVQQVRSKYPGAAEAWSKQTGGEDFADSAPYISGHGSLRATDVNGGTYTWEGKGWICHECGTTPEGKDPSVECAICNRGPGMNETTAGAVAGFQVPMGIKKRKAKVDELLRRHSDINEAIVLSYFSSLNEDQGEQVGVRLDKNDPTVADDMRQHAVRELIRKKVREVVRKKAGGGGYTLYAPNPGKKGGSKPVGNFPTKIGAKRAELARFPPKDPEKLKRLRKSIDKAAKTPKKAAERERIAAKVKGTDTGKKPTSKKESVNESGPFSPSGTTGTTATTSFGSNPNSKVNQDPKEFFAGLQAIGKDKVTDRANYIQNHLKDPGFISNVKKTPNGDKAIKQLYTMANNSAPKTGSVTRSFGEAVEKRKVDFFERAILSKIIKKSLSESLFREERTESEWDDYISKLSKQALAGDGKFQSLQKNISKKTEGILGSAFSSIKKAVGKSVQLKSFGVKHDAKSGKTYLAFSADIGDATAEPFYVHVEGGVPKIEVSDTAKIALTKADPDAAKLFRAELVTVQERVLDDMDDLSRAIQSRDKYLTKLETEVDSYVAGLAPLQISLLKQLLVKKYRKIT